MILLVGMGAVLGLLNGLAALPATAASSRASQVLPSSGASPFACLDPYSPSPTSRRSWISTSLGGTDQPGSGTTSPGPTPTTLKFAESVAAAFGPGWTVRSRLQANRSGCTVFRAAEADGPHGQTVWFDEFQVRRPIGTYSFPLLGGPTVGKVKGLVQSFVSVVPDKSWMEIVGATTHGFVVDVYVRSAHSPDTSGWPTTVAPPVSTPDTPLTIGEPQVINAVARVVTEGQRRS